jgi:sugar O-acyltransferase (sialic acid O-acetyltransferase NeuD family)
MNEDDGIYVVGAGGHGKVIIATLQDAGHRVLGVLDDDPTTWGHSIMGIAILGHSSLLEQKPNSKALLAIGNNRIRRDLARRMPATQWITVVHPRAYVHSSVTLGAGTVVFAGAVIQPGTTIGEHVIINTAATVDHDCRLGDYVHIAPGVHLAGGVTVGDSVLMGIGSCVIPCIEIGPETVIGAGAAIVNNIPGKVTAFGIPARIQGIQ